MQKWAPHSGGKMSFCPHLGRSEVVASYKMDMCSLELVQIQCLAQGHLSWVDVCEYQVLILIIQLNDHL